MNPDYEKRVRLALMSLGIAPELIERRSLPLCGEATELQLAETGEDGRQFMLSPEAARAWREMAAAAGRDGVVLRLASAFRSLDRQIQILGGKLAEGISLDEILRESAPPGYSEHHTGRAIDITTPGSDALEEKFETTDAYRWLARNAGRFDFVLSFPRGNHFGYAYEPWHWSYMPVSKLVIRGVDASESRVVSALVHRSFNALAAADWEPKARETFLRESSPGQLENIAPSVAYAAGAFLFGEMVGFVSLPSPSTLAMLFVDPRHVRRGIGRALWESARRNVETRFPDVMAIELNSTPVAVPFYRSVGFTPISAELVQAGCRVTRMAYRRVT